MGTKEYGDPYAKKTARGKFDNGKCCLCGTKIERDNAHREFPTPFVRGIGKMYVCRNHNIGEWKKWVVQTNPQIKEEEI